MGLPPSELERLSTLATRYGRGGFVALGDEHQFLMRAARADPTALGDLVSVLVRALNVGHIMAGTESAAMRWLKEFAETSEHLRAKIESAISKELLDYYCDFAEPDLRKVAQALSETLKVERPRHYFDLCRNMLTNNGSIFVIGAGFSYDSYAPLLREMEGIACSVLWDLGIPEPRRLYHDDERKAWHCISGEWHRFQNHVASALLPKEPSQQHLILAELFHEQKITHIVSFNWDDLIEKAYNKLYNEDITLISGEGTTSDHALWKLHGDIAKPDERWVLPFEDGRVFEALEQIASQTTLPTFVIGYREQEEIVRSRLITPLENRAGITRIRPDLASNPPESCADNAVMAMKKIKAGLEAAEQSTYPA